MSYKIKTSKAFILSTKQEGESDRFLTVYTELFGKVYIFVKSVRETNAKLTGFAYPYRYLDITFIEGKKKIFKEAKIINELFDVWNSQKKYTLYTRFLKNLNKFTNFNEKDKRIFDITEWFVSKLNTEDENKSEFLYIVALYFFLYFSGFATIYEKITPDELFSKIKSDKKALNQVMNRIKIGLNNI